MALPATLEEFTAFVEKFTATRGFDDIAATLGLEPHAVDGDSISMSMPLTEPLSQANGMFSAAALFGAADITGTFLALQAYAGTGQFPLAIQSNLNFLSNSTSSPAVATARVLRGGGSVAVAEVVVRDADGKDLVHSTFTYVIKERKLGK
ncbi:PaaI family thioesterase [Arthrobacter halodurans]|uniref:PaaI family thioesterase n=1 Tax=Arthrobacter halodurans TaxID=516699 RepID=A0ABV4UIU1_9MICC